MISTFTMAVRPSSGWPNHHFENCTPNGLRERSTHRSCQQLLGTDTGVTRDDPSTWGADPPQEQRNSTSEANPESGD